ncbi:MAG: undecaprenyl-phosphate glucose phosphotransferase [Salibacteraceae bacterium]
MKLQFLRFSRTISLIGDAILLNLVFGIGFIGYSPGETGPSNSLIWLVLAANGSAIISATVTKLYSIYRVTTGLKIFSKVVNYLLLHFLLMESILGITGMFPNAQMELAQIYIALFALMPIWRGVSVLLLRISRQVGHFTRKVVIVGSGEAAREFQEMLELHPEYGFRFQGFFDDQNPSGRYALGSIKELKQYVAENPIDEIYCSMSSVANEQIDELIDFAENHLIRIKFLPHAKRVHHFKKFKIDYYRNCPVMVIKSSPLDDATNQLLKRAFDVVFSLGVFALVLSWLFPLIALLIKLDSRGPVFFFQRRSGFNGKKFWCWKFRTMYHRRNAEFQQATRNDPRVTRIGKFLRKTNIDELPQFINVLLGNMSIIGPRPHAMETDGQYMELIHKYRYRLSVKPGISGLSQVKGYRGETKDPEEMRNRVKMDIFYLENWSFFFDLRLTLMTVFNMIRGERNAY